MAKKKLNDWARGFLISMIILFIIGGLMGAFYFLFGQIDEIAMRILLTILAFFVFSLLGLASSRLFGKDQLLNYLAVVGIVAGLIALGIILPVIWDVWSVGAVAGKIAIISTIWAVSVSQLALISGNNKDNIVKTSYFITIGLIVIVASMLTFITVTEANVGEIFWRVFGFTAVLDLVGTIVTPLIRRFRK